MAKKNYGLVSSLEVLTGFITKLISVIKDRGGTEEDILRLLADSESNRFLEEIAMKIIGGTSVEVDYSMSLTQMIQLGKYEYVEKQIIEQFQPQIKNEGIVVVNIEPVRLHTLTHRGNEAIQELDRKDLRPTTLPEFLAYLAKKQPDFNIAALGSIYQYWNHRINKYVVCYERKNRRLILKELNSYWSNDTRFAAVHK